MMIACFIVLALLVGILVGCTGIGGIMLVPAIAFILNMSSHLAMGTALFTAIFVTILGSVMYIRLGAMDWKMTGALCAGALPCSYAGAMVKAMMSASLLNLILGLLILLAGLLVLCPVRGQNRAFMQDGSPWRYRIFLLVGGGVAFVAAMTGAGGPVLSTPLLISLGISPLHAIASGQVYAIVVGLFGSIGNFQNGAIDWVTGGWISAVQMVGVLFGVWLVRRINAEGLRRMVAGLCLLTGIFIVYFALKHILIDS